MCVLFKKMFSYKEEKYSTHHILYYCNLTSFLVHVFTCQAHFPSSIVNVKIYTDA